MSLLRVSTFLAAAVLAATAPIALNAAPTVDARAGGGLATQEAVYAAFMVNITRFIQWPENSFADRDAPLVIGTVPNDPINEELDRAVEGEKIGAHAMRTLRLHSLDQAQQCHAIFLSSANAEARALLARVAGKPILVVSDAAILELGGHVRFLSRPPRTEIQIQLRNLQASGLQARAQLLRVAKVVEP